jgi:hypothetical protein
MHFNRVVLSKFAALEMLVKYIILEVLEALFVLREVMPVWL